MKKEDLAIVDKKTVEELSDHIDMVGTNLLPELKKVSAKIEKNVAFQKSENKESKFIVEIDKRLNRLELDIYYLIFMQVISIFVFLFFYIFK